MFKYTIKAFNRDVTIGSVDVINVTVTADDEPQALSRAAEIVERTDFTVIAIEDVRSLEIKKIQE